MRDYALLMDLAFDLPCIIILILMHVSPWHEFNFKPFLGGVKPLFEDKKHGLKLY